MIRRFLFFVSVLVVSAVVVAGDEYIPIGTAPGNPGAAPCVKEYEEDDGCPVVVTVICGSSQPCQMAVVAGPDMGTRFPLVEWANSGRYPKSNVYLVCSGTTQCIWDPLLQKCWPDINGWQHVYKQQVLADPRFQCSHEPF